MLKQPGAMQAWGNWELAVTSELTEVEVLRTLDRLRATDRASEFELATWHAELAVYISRSLMVPLDRGILRRAAEPLPKPLGALDAIHLATARSWMESNGQDLVVLTHDQQLAVCARACNVLVHFSS